MILDEQRWVVARHPIKTALAVGLMVSRIEGSALYMGLAGACVRNLPIAKALSTYYKVLD